MNPHYAPGSFWLLTLTLASNQFDKRSGRVSDQAVLVEGKEHHGFQALRLGQVHFFRPCCPGVADAHQMTALRVQESLCRAQRHRLSAAVEVAASGKTKAF